MDKNKLSIGILVTALFAIYFRMNGQEMGYFVLKPITTILIILLTFLYSKEAPQLYRRNVLIALCFCFLGDVLLLKDEYFVYGLGAFLLGHLFFLVAFMTQGGFKNRLLPLLVLAMIGGGVYGLLAPTLGAMKIPVAIYIIVITLMAWQAIALYLKDNRRVFLGVAIGSVVFMVSDTLIALDKFYMEIPFAGIWILVTYWLAIWLIADSTTQWKAE